MNAADVIILAMAHVNNGAFHSESAKLCLAEAVDAYNTDHPDEAKTRALRSLKYSVGILHPDFQRASSEVQE